MKHNVSATPNDFRDSKTMVLREARSLATATGRKLRALSGTQKLVLAEAES